MNTIPGVPTRAHLADLCNERRITVAAEIGTDLGVYACQFLERWRGDFLLCIDPYEPYPHMPYDRTGDMWMALLALGKYHGRAKLIRERSVECALQRKWPEWLTIGFAYIDGAHTLPEVRADIEAWWGVVNGGGILAGHDWNLWPDVRRAVTEFFEPMGLSVHVTQDKDIPTSWYVHKP